MGRRISDSDPNGKEPCAFCRTMRVVVVFAVMVVMLMAYANKLHWLKDIDFTSLFGYLVVVFFFTVLGYRVWDEYGRPKKTQAQLDAKRALREKQFDELDALEAERAAADKIKSQATETDTEQPADIGPSKDEVVALETTEVDDAERVLQETPPSEPSQHDLEPKLESSSQPEQLDLLGFSTPKKADD